MHLEGHSQGLGPSGWIGALYCAASAQPSCHPSYQRRFVLIPPQQCCVFGAESVGSLQVNSMSSALRMGWKTTGD